MNKTNPIKYSLKFVAFCFLCAFLTVVLIMLINKFDGRGKEADADIAKAPLTVVIDAGHGGEDGGTSGLYAVEKDINLSIAELLAEMLRTNGINVVMTRTEDILLYDPTSDYHGKKKVQDLAKRLEIARSVENTVFVSIHMNAFPQSQYKGLQVYYSQNNAESKKVADLIQSNTKKYLQEDNGRKTKPATSSIFLLHRLESPAVLVECGFLSNPEECKLLATEEYRKQLAFIIFCSINDYIANAT